jgi:CHAT domain-containing protein
MLGAVGQAAGGKQRGVGEQGVGIKADLSHPYYWAAFIQSGDWRGMGTR